MATKLAGIVAALDRHQPNGAGHARVGDAHDSRRGRGDVETERSADMGRDRAFRAADIERPEAAAERARGIDAAEHELGIGQRRPQSLPWP